MSDKQTESNQSLRRRAEEKITPGAVTTQKVQSLDEANLLLHELKVHQIELEMQNDELRLAQAELESSRTRYFDLYDMAPVGYVTLNSKGIILEANLTASALLGVARGALASEPFSRFLLKEDQERWYWRRKQLFEARKLQAWSAAMLRADGSSCWVHLQATVTQDTDGAPLCRIAISDIAELMRTEEVLRERVKELNCLYAIAGLIEKEDNLETIFQGTAELMTHGWFYPDSACARITFDGQQYQTDNFWETKWRQAADFGGSSENSLPAGRVELCYRDEHPVRDEGPFLKEERSLINAIAESLKIAVDRKQAEAALRNANEELETRVQERTEELKKALDTLQGEIHDRLGERKDAERRDAVANALLKQFVQQHNRKEYMDAAVELIRDFSGCHYAGLRVRDRDGNMPDGSCVDFSPEFPATENLLSIKREQCACTRIAAGRPEAQDLAAMSREGSFYVNDSPQFLEALSLEQKSRFRGACIQNGFVSIAVIPIRYREEVLGAIHLADERAEMVPLRKVEFLEQLALILGEAIYRFGIEEDRARLVSAVESTAEAMVITDAATGFIEYVNPAFENLTGYAKGEAQGRTLHFLEAGKNSREYYTALRETLARDGAWTGRLLNKKKDGSLYHEEYTVSPVRNRNGELINYIHLKRDVSEKLRLEAIAESVNTMNNIGYVFSGVRHEIGNPVNSLNMILGILRSKLDTLDTDAIRDYLGRMAEQVGRVEYILRSLKSFNLYETQQLQNIAVSSFFENFLPLVKDDFESKGIVIDVSMDPAAGWMFVDPRALQQVLLNVFTNAADAMNGSEAPNIRLAIFRSGAMIQIRIQDNGCGIPEEKLKSIFQPFYTTKPQGTGLGLVIVKKMLSHMNGAIELESRQDAGTTVSISIPEGIHENQ